MFLAYSGIQDQVEDPVQTDKLNYTSNTMKNSSSLCGKFGLQMHYARLVSKKSENNSDLLRRKKGVKLLMIQNCQKCAFFKPGGFWGLLRSNQPLT